MGIGPLTSSALGSDLIASMDAAEQSTQQAELALASGDAFTLPGQDPAAAGQAVLDSAAVGQNTNEQSSLQAAQDWAQQTDAALQQANSLLAQVQQNALSAANGTETGSDRQATGDVVSQLAQQLLQVANSQYEGLYLFSGQQVSTPPFASLTAAYAGDAQPISYQVGQGISMAPNVPGTVFAPILQAAAQVQSDLQQPRLQSATQASAASALGLSGTVQIDGTAVSVAAGDSLTAIAAAVNAAAAGVTASVVPVSGGYALSVQSGSSSPLSVSDPNGVWSGLQMSDTLGGADLAALTAAADTLSSAQGSLGAVEQGLQLQSQTLTSQNQTLTDAQATLTGADVAQESILYSEASQALQAAVTVAGKGILPSAFSYL